MLAGVLSLTDVVWAHPWGVLSAFSPIDLTPGNRTVEVAVAVAGLLLLRVAVGLRRAKRSALVLAVLACATVCFVDLVRNDWRPIESTVGTALLIGLLVSRARFVSRDDPTGPGFAGRVAGQFLAVGVAVGLVLLHLPGHVASGTSLVGRLDEIARSFVGLGGHLTISSDDYADAVHATLLGFGLLTLVSGVFLVLRSFGPTAQLTADDEARLRRVLARHGGTDSL